MDWQSEINAFPPFEIKESGLDVPAKEASQAVSKYEKALKNAQNDSLDIAIIELRKLVVLYPEMGQAAMLLGCCQMQENHVEDALKNFNKAGRSVLPINFVNKLDKYIKDAEATLILLQTKPEYKANRSKYPINSTPEIISTTPGKWKKVKIASEKEKREVMQSNSAPQVKETFVSEKMEINWVKTGFITLVILAIIGVGSLIYVFVPKAVDNLLNKENRSDEKLEWLLTKLTKAQTSDNEIEKILKEYDNQFYPTINSSSTISKDTVSNVTPTIAPPTPTTAPTDSDRIVLAARAISEAEKIGKTDPKKVMTLINEATKALLNVNENATAPSLTVNAGEIQAKALLLMKNVVNAACYPLYKDAKVKTDAKQYEQAIVLYLKVYDINPDYLDGGSAYNLGKAYSLSGQVENANKYFQYVVTKFPGTDVAKWAGARIKPTATINE